jgi:hypothetical protein
MNHDQAHKEEPMSIIAPLCLESRIMIGPFIAPYIMPWPYLGKSMLQKIIKSILRIFPNSIANHLQTLMISIHLLIKLNPEVVSFVALAQRFIHGSSSNSFNRSLVRPPVPIHRSLAYHK